MNKIKQVRKKHTCAQCGLKIIPGYRATFKGRFMKKDVYIHHNPHCDHIRLLDLLDSILIPEEKFLSVKFFDKKHTNKLIEVEVRR